MKKSTKRILLSILAVLIIGGGYCGYRFIKHERGQTAAINDLRGKVALLQEKNTEFSGVNEFVKAVSNESFDYLAIGNSITLHPITDFWWGEWGMAASTEENDYYHRTVRGLEKRLNTDINSVAYNYSVWEVQGYDRTETYEFLDKYLTEGIDLITVQLSENASDLSNYEIDLKVLLQHIEDRCGDDTQVIVIDDFWSAEKHEMKKVVCDELGIDFVDLSDLRGNDIYQAGMGTIVFGEDGKEHIIEHSGVAAHPGDRGMEVIAERVLELVDND